MFNAESSIDGEIGPAMSSAGIPYDALNLSTGHLDRAVTILATLDKMLGMLPFVGTPLEDATRV